MLGCLTVITSRARALGRALEYFLIWFHNDTADDGYSCLSMLKICFMRGIKSLVIGHDGSPARYGSHDKNHCHFAITGPMCLTAFVLCGTVAPPRSSAYSLLGVLASSVVHVFNDRAAFDSPPI